MAHVKRVGEVWACSVCDNIVEVLIVGGGQLVCCGQPMVRIEEEEQDLYDDGED